MAGRSKQDARAAFDDNLADADTLVKLTKALRNNRQRRMRRELRERLGEALGIRHRDWDALDCTESDDLFAVFKPGAAIGRELVSDNALRPLLRQALVAPRRGKSASSSQGTQTQGEGLALGGTTDFPASL